jgi:uncharacterized membrane protein
MKNEKKPVSKKRRTIDDLLGINGLLAVALIGSPLGSAFSPIGYVCGLVAISKMIQNRKDRSVKKKTRVIRWILLLLLLIEAIIISNIQ